MTASQIAKATGIAPGTVSTPLTKLAKTGEFAKAERGYKPPSGRPLARRTRASQRLLPGARIGRVTGVAAHRRLAFLRR